MLLLIVFLVLGYAAIKIILPIIGYYATLEMVRKDELKKANEQKQI